jgi:tetratricopeptide (TPR) repeat protein
LDYLLVVETDNGKSSKDEGLPGLGFNLLPEEEAQHVRADAMTIQRLNLPEGASTFALAQLYSSHGLYAEAIEMLEELATANSRAASVYRALGELYQQVGLLAFAESHHSRALEVAETFGDVESIAASQAGLGEVYMAFGNKTEAIRWFTHAQTAYESLGDLKRANQIAEQLAELNQ